jgi:hypothetical protein
MLLPIICVFVFEELPCLPAFLIPMAAMLVITAVTLLLTRKISGTASRTGMRFSS